jgi:ketosteroid isomerase-like protein
VTRNRAKIASYSLALIFTFVGALRAQAPPPQSQQRLNPELQRAVEQFAKAVDDGDVAAVAAAYSPEFLNVRVADDGGFVELNRDQILALLKPETGRTAGVNSIPTRNTIIHHAEVIGDMGFVLVTREKDLGTGWEPMYYSLVWRKRAGKWELLREFVHQRTVPKYR